MTYCNAALTAADDEEKAKKDLTLYISGSFCLGLLQGITHLNLTYQQMLKEDELLFCLPKSGFTNIQAARIVVKYLNDHPEKLHLPDSVLAIGALIIAYPCKKNTP